MHETPSDDALYAALNSRSVTDAAHALVESLRCEIESHETITGTNTYKRRGRKLEEFEGALGAFIADLLRAAQDDDAAGWVFRSMRAESFSGERVSYKTFRRLVTALTAIRLVEQIKGAPRWAKHPFDEDGAPCNTGGTATRFRATRSLLDLAMSYGITPENVDEHFFQELPKHPLVLKTASSKDAVGRKIDSKRMSFVPTPETERLESDLKRLNSFLDSFKLTGGIHRGYFRVFNLGDHSDFAWNKGGRLYSQGEDSYQRLKEAKRVLMTIDGNAVVEIDIKASYLTILHGLLGMPFDASKHDPYAVDGLQPLPGLKDMRRWVVKSWTVATLGHHQHHIRWPEKIAADFNKKTGRVLGKTYPITTVRRAMERKHPVLSGWGNLGISWADLMFVESQAIVTTMMELMDVHHAPGFSVHDSLVVREKDLQIAKECLMRNYGDLCGLKPALETAFRDGTLE